MFLSLYLHTRHWCGISDARIYVDDNLLANSSLYQCSDESFVLWLGGDGRGTYAVYTATQEVAHVNDTNFIYLGFGLFSWKIPFDSVVLGQEPAKTDNIRPNLEIENGRIEFSPYMQPNSERLIVKWNSE